MKIFLVYLFIAIAVTVTAVERLKVGNYFPKDLRSSDTPLSELNTETCHIKTWKIEEPGSTYISLHFSQFNLNDDEFLKVSNPDETQTYTMQGEGRPRSGGVFWGSHVQGDVVILELHSCTSNPGSGFHIDQMALGFM
eukprot:CAMPEP_0113935226 /NCGR_PEP_ID=MMETSP1339-20121228/2412_1 /TAXON_ID=94617 /ORGANISM="Fibrocapsa japonica" /LENGTH=137 /DNA_ID=CAMNT_0000937295 /DNA_START=46 /DNA_END=459 /DNA_ORIENTATION=- /assembly_acc=CAM_ASM_000762